MKKILLITFLFIPLVIFSQLINGRIISDSVAINEVMIINNLGQIVATYSETSIINIDQLANGVYQIMIKTENNIVVLPLIKIH